MTLTLVPTAIEKYAQEPTEVPARLFEKLRQSTWARMSSAQMHVGLLEGTFLRMWARMTGAPGRKITLRMGPALETLKPPGHWPRY